jgi:hypothetical protein
MMIRVVDGAPTPYSVRQLKADHPDTSFPRTPSDALLAEYDVFRVQSTPRPETGPDEVAEPGDPALVDGQWVQTWDVRPLTPEELDDRATSERLSRREEASRRLSNDLVTEKARTIVLDEETPFSTVVDLAPLFEPWEVGVEYHPGVILYYHGTVIEVLQAHTSQEDWQPPDVPALYRVWRDPDVAEPWVQPAGAHDAYPLGAEVTHNGRLWISEVADNVWEPGVFGWGDLGPD